MDAGRVTPGRDDEEDDQVRSVRRSGAVAVALVAGLLAGCTAQPGVAAVIGDRKVSQSELETASGQLAPILNTVDTGTLILAIVLSPEMLDAAAEQGVAVSAEAARDQMDQVAEAVEAEPTDWSPLAVEIIQVVLAGQALGTSPTGIQALQEAERAALEQDVELNPRYGTMDPETGRISPMDLPWIVPAQQQTQQTQETG